MKYILILLFIIFIICINYSVNEGFQISEEQLNNEDIIYFPPDLNQDIKFKRINDVSKCSPIIIENSAKTINPINYPNAEENSTVFLKDCLEACNDNSECQGIQRKKNWEGQEVCNLLSNKCYNSYNDSNDCIRDDNGTFNCIYNKDDIVPHQFFNSKNLENRFYKTTEKYPDLNQYNQNKINEDIEEVNTITECLDKCRTNADCKSVSVKNFGDTNNKKLQCDLYNINSKYPTAKNNNCNDNICHYNKYLCSDYECREIQNENGESNYQIFCNNNPLNNTKYQTMVACNDRINVEKNKSPDERLVCPNDCDNGPMLYEDIQFKFDTILNRYSMI